MAFPTDVTTVLVSKIATIRGTVNTDTTTAIVIRIPTWRLTNPDLMIAIRDAAA